jgi:hypothetical protein
MAALTFFIFYWFLVNKFLYFACKSKHFTTNFGSIPLLFLIFSPDKGEGYGKVCFYMTGCKG